MRGLDQSVRSQGATFTVIGSGSPEEASSFQAEYLGPEVRLLTDPALSSFRAMELRRSLWPNVRPRTYWRGLRSWRRGARPGRVMGDSLQQGGAFVITPFGEVPFSYICQKPEDHVDPGAVLGALRALGQGA